MARRAAFLALCLRLASPVESSDVCPEAPVVTTCTGPQSALEYLNELTANGYDRSRRPPCGDGVEEGPTVVEAQLYVATLNNVDQKLGHATINGYLRTWWNDPRLAFNATEMGGCFDKLDMNGAEADAIWLPDLYIHNLVTKTTGAGFAYLTSISPDGSVWRSEQVLITVKSSLDLSRIPFDEQSAKVVLASYSQTIDNMRLKPWNGTIGAGVSGVALEAPALSSVVWAFPNDETDDPTKGFKAPGEVEILIVDSDSDARDYLTITLWYKRKAKYFVDQVIVPCVLFLLVSYIQFFVAPTAAPARAALAVIPILIMRTMGNSVYSSLPEGSQEMWLADFLQTSTFLCTFGAFEFGFVQLLLMNESAKREKLEGLKKANQMTEKLFKLSREKGWTLFTLLNEFKPKEITVSLEEQQKQEQAAQAEAAECDAHEDEGNASQASAAPAPAPQSEAKPQQSKTSSSERDSKLMMASSEQARKHGIKEKDIAFILYAHQIFDRYDVDNSQNLSPDEVRKALRYFNIYMGATQVETVMCMVERDHGEATPIDESQVVYTFSKFAYLLMHIEEYTLAHKPAKSCIDGVMSWFQSTAPSHMTDFFCRVAFPIFIALQLIIFFSIVDNY